MAKTIRPPKFIVRIRGIIPHHPHIPRPFGQDAVDGLVALESIIEVLLILHFIIDVHKDTDDLVRMSALILN